TCALPILDYWNHYRLELDRFDFKTAHELFDTAVNCGVQVAAIFMQKSLNILNRNQNDFPDLKIDGWLGNVSYQAYQKVDKTNLLKCLNGYQFMWYESIVGKSPTQEKYMNGWLKRVGFFIEKNFCFCKNERTSDEK